MVRVNYPAVAALVSKWIEAGPPGTKSGLARACDVTPVTAGRWATAYNTPEPDYWPSIEAFFGQPAGTLAKAAGLEVATLDAPPPDEWALDKVSPSVRAGIALERTAELERRLADLTARVDALEQPAAPVMKMRPAAKRRPREDR